MTSPNPYNYNLPVGPEMFFGREKDLETLIHLLTTTPGDSIALIGGRRMGKTSLLEMILQRLETLAEESTTGFLPLPLFLDLTGEEVDSPVSFFRLVSQEAHALLTDLLDTPLHTPPTQLKPLAPAFGRVLKQWDRTMTQEGYHLRLILLLDECEEIVTQSWTPKLYRALRFLLVGRSTRSLLKVVMVGSHRFLTQVSQRGSPLRNVLTYHTLRVLNPHATSQLITQPTGGILTDETAQIVARQGGRHPFLTQYLMHHLWGAELESATSETVQRIVARFPRKRTDFWDWVNALGQSRLNIYSILAQNQAPMTERDLRAALTSPLSDLPQALEALCYHGVVVHELGESYRIAGQMFHDWFIANMADKNISDPEITSKVLRSQLKQMFDDPELDAFCMDNYPKIYDKFGRGMDRNEKINLLLDYCRRLPKGYEQLLIALEEKKNADHTT